MTLAALRGEAVCAVVGRQRPGAVVFVAPDACRGHGLSPMTRVTGKAGVGAVQSEAVVDVLCGRPRGLARVAACTVVGKEGVIRRPGAIAIRLVAGHAGRVIVPGRPADLVTPLQRPGGKRDQQNLDADLEEAELEAEVSAVDVSFGRLDCLQHSTIQTGVSPYVHHELELTVNLELVGNLFYEDRVQKRRKSVQRESAEAWAASRDEVFILVVCNRRSTKAWSR